MPPRLCFFLLTLLPVASCGNSSSRSPIAPTSSCLDRAQFGDPAESPYVLPYPVGTAYEVLQSYCSNGSHRDRFPYDYLMGFGDEVVAARGGVVRTLVDHWADDDKDRYHNNHVFIEHDNGTIALYAHFQQRGFSVRVGDRVSRGQVIGSVGESGTPTPCPYRECGILHFGVYRHFGGEEMPINFRNAGGQLDTRGGLMRGETYEAMPY